MCNAYRRGINSVLHRCMGWPVPRDTAVQNSMLTNYITWNRGGQWRKVLMKEIMWSKTVSEKVENILDDPMVWMDVWKESGSDDLWSYLWGVILVMLMDDRWSVYCGSHVPWTPVSSLQQWVINWTVHSINNLTPKFPFPDSFITAAQEN